MKANLNLTPHMYAGLSTSVSSRSVTQGGALRTGFDSAYKKLSTSFKSTFFAPVRNLMSLASLGMANVAFASNKMVSADILSDSATVFDRGAAFLLNNGRAAEYVFLISVVAGVDVLANLWPQSRPVKSTTETQNSKQSDTKQTDAPISKSKVDSVSQIEDSSNHPDTIGDYQILADLGSGGQGSVYRARRMSDGVEVALKTIYNDRYMFDQVALVRNLGVRSPNLAKVLDFDFKSNPPFVVMEFFSSPNLSAHMREFQEQCDAPQVWKSYFLNVAFGVGSALSEMHKNGIVHRDVRIPNIVFRDFDPEQTLQTGHVTPVLIDYGLSAKVGLSPLQNFAGVARCMAPELFTPERFDQARNVLVSPTLDVRQDIYSFGVMLFQMLTSQLPYPDMPPSNRFSFQSMHDIHVFLKHQAVPDPREYNFMIPDSLAEIIMKCMQHDPNQRYQSINDVMRDLSVVAKKSGLGHLAKITL